MAKVQDYRDIIGTSIKAFSPSELNKQDGLCNPRASIDSTVTGWGDHGITRLIGNVSLQYNEKGPFFEVLINSARDSQGTCFPFSGCVLANRESAEIRWKVLKLEDSGTASVANDVYYSSFLTSPSTFIQEYTCQLGKAPGSNSMRILKGLEHASNKRMKGQTIGNCWIKQTKRCVLLSFYLEILTQRPEFNNEQAWRLAKKLYAHWKGSTYEEIEKLMTAGISSQLRTLAEKKIADVRFA